MFRTLSLSALVALVGGAVIESKPQVHIQKAGDTGKVLAGAGFTVAAAAGVAAVADAMATAGSSGNNDKNIRYEVVKFEKYGSYTGPLVEGNIVITGENCASQDEGNCELNYQWDLTNLAADCKNGKGSNPNSCGIHVHGYAAQPAELTSCALCAAESSKYETDIPDTLTGPCPHYFGPKPVGLFPANPSSDPAGRSPDPWADIGYQDEVSVNGGVASSQADANVNIKLSGGLVGRVMIIHDFDGQRVACGQIIEH